MKPKGLVVIVSAPSGAGKSTICAELLKVVSNSVYSVSATTRAPRKGEKHGKSYFFLTEKEFKRSIARGKLLEWAKVHGHYYGTPREFITKNVARGKIVVLDIDVQGALKIKRKRLAGAVYVFIMTPTFEILKQRLVSRGLDDKKVMELRLRNARGELRCLKHYDYLVINDKVETAVGKLKAIITAELLKTARAERRNI